SAASALNRSSGSVLEGRILNHHDLSAAVTVVPSSVETVTSWNLANTLAMAASGSSTCELISPEATYGVYCAANDDAVSCWLNTASTCIAASIPVSALKKSRK